MLAVACMAVGPASAGAAPAAHAGASAHTSGAAADPGRTIAGRYKFHHRTYRFIEYVPRSLRPGRRVPLVVMVHGAQTTAEQEIHATGFNRIAEREGFVVLYPDVDDVGRIAPGPINQSWLFYDPLTYFRGYGDAAAIASLTRDTMTRAPIDPRRVYVVGVSAGGLMQSALTASYPDLYTAAVNVESAGYMDAFCFTTGTGLPVELSAQLAFAEMGPRARVVPTMVITSDADLAFPHQCGEKALEQALRTGDLALSGHQNAPLALTPASISHQREPGGYRYDVSTYRGPGGCLVAEKWLIHGMPHKWPGGPTDDTKWAGYADRKAPNGAQGAWDFVRQFTMPTTRLPAACS
jgi:poly(hydroxyalkanoate) depolymerase family esterase